MDKDYIKELRRRATESRVYKKYQLIGLEIAKTLGDEKHKSLYIKLAKESSMEKLLRLAKNVSERRGIKNKGAYFMSILPKSSAKKIVTKVRSKRVKGGK